MVQELTDSVLQLSTGGLNLNYDCHIPHLRVTSEHGISGWVVERTHPFLHCKQDGTRARETTVGEQEMGDEDRIYDTIRSSSLS